MISHDRALFLITLSQVCEERAVSDSPLRLSRQAVEKPGCAIRRQPGFQHIFGKIESKIGNGQSHSISTLPFF